MPMLLGLIGIWYNNFFGAETRRDPARTATTSRSLTVVPPAARHGEQRQVGRPRGQPGRRGRRARSCGASPAPTASTRYYQLIHQGTKLIPCDFIGFCQPEPRGRRPPEPAHGQLLRAARGAGVRQDRARRSRPRACPRDQVPHRTFAGQPPDQLDPRRRSSRRTCSASSIALYEHKVFTQGAIWNINCFDQWGVELGKKLAQRIVPELDADRRADARHDSSTNALISRYRRLR